VTRTIRFTKPVDRDKLQAELQRLAPQVYRAKGFVPTSAGTVYADVSAAGASCEPASADGGALVVIFPPAAAPAVDAFARCILPAGSLNVLG